MMDSAEGAELIMKPYDKDNVGEWFRSLSDKEFRELLEDAGFKIEDGEGKIIFTEEKIFEGKVEVYLDELDQFRYRIKNNAAITYDGDDFDCDLSEFKGKNVRLTIEVVE